MDILTSYIPPVPSSKPHFSTLEPSFSRGSSSSNNLLNRSSKQSLHAYTKLVDRDVHAALNNTSCQVNVPKDHRSSVPERTFTPLTPIIASPITTPSTSMASSKLYVTVSNDEGAKEKLATLHSEISLVGDYFTKGALAPIPTKEAASVVDHSSGRAGIIEPITYIPPVASLPASSDAHGLSERDNIQKRRASLPLMMISKPLPPNLPPFLSKTTSELITSPLRDGVPTDKPIKHRAKFSLDSDDGEGIWFDSLDEPEALEDGERDENRSADEWLKDKSKDNIRRYHALMELLSTEMGYLMDLRELVNVSVAFVMAQEL